ncbi:MAG: glutamate--tRNA ligase [Methanomicrobiales archaeon]|nr:glutamate--tRNA ligase [Methanomicrobiales archaeon]
MDDATRETLLVHALANAVRHENVPQPGAVLAMVLGKHPGLRARAKELSGALPGVIAEVADLSPDARKIRLAELAPGLHLDEGESCARERTLPPLEEVGPTGVVMRFAPNPSGPLHLGHARAALLNDAYVRKYGGKYILRIEDTDPKRVDPDAYGMVQDDIRWLGVNVTDIVYQSDRLDIYYDHCRRLIALGGAYVCTCENEHFKELRHKMAACPCRKGDVDSNLARFEDMLAGSYYEGEATVRVKTDLDHPDPAMRDFPAFRILKSPIHPRVDAEVYPLMNYSVTIDDHLLGVTHVIRGKDHIANTRRQQYIFAYFGWEVPVYVHYGRMGIEGVILSTSQMRQGIREGTYAGWDDIRLGTLRALARRGISPDAVRAAVLEIGTGETDIQFSWENLFAKNRDIVDPVANRYFFVRDPVCLPVAHAPCQVAHPLLHPGSPALGTRTLPFNGNVIIPGAEAVPGRFLRCKDLFNICIEDVGGTICAKYAGESLAEARAVKAPIVQWLPDGDAAVHCTLHTPEGDQEGLCEAVVAQELGRVVQFERVGFARVDRADTGSVKAYFTHR